MAAPSFDEISAGIRARMVHVCRDFKTYQIAEMTGGNRETVRRYIQGVSEPCAAFLSALCVALKISPAWLLLGEGDPRPGTPEIKPSLDARKAERQAVPAQLNGPRGD